MSSRLVGRTLVNDTQDLHKALALPGLFGVVTDRPDVAFQGQRTLIPPDEMVTRAALYDWLEIATLPTLVVMILTNPDNTIQPLYRKPFSLCKPRVKAPSAPWYSCYVRQSALSSPSRFRRL